MGRMLGDHSHRDDVNHILINLNSIHVVVYLVIHKQQYLSRPFLLGLPHYVNQNTRE